MEYTLADFLFKKTAELKADPENDDVRWTLAYVVHVFLGGDVGFDRKYCDSEHIIMRSGGTVEILRCPDGRTIAQGDTSYSLIAKVEAVIGVKITDEQFNYENAINYFDMMKCEEEDLPWDLEERFKKVVEERGGSLLSPHCCSKAELRARIKAIVDKHGLDKMNANHI